MVFACDTYAAEVVALFDIVLGRKLALLADEHLNPIPRLQFAWSLVVVHAVFPQMIVLALAACSFIQM